MCGIAGYLTEKPIEKLDAALCGMVGAIVHRGPDDDGFFEATARNSHCKVGLAHRRLSIIDLSTGHQPMGNENGSVQIVFNGEIYNFQGLRDELIAKVHVFRTHSDTETIVHAYEEWGTLQRNCSTKTGPFFIRPFVFCSVSTVLNQQVFVGHLFAYLVYVQKHSGIVLFAKMFALFCIESAVVKRCL